MFVHLHFQTLWLPDSLKVMTEKSACPLVEMKVERLSYSILAVVTKIPYRLSGLKNKHLLLTLL